MNLTFEQLYPRYFSHFSSPLQHASRPQAEFLIVLLYRLCIPIRRRNQQTAQVWCQTTANCLLTLPKNYDIDASQLELQLRQKLGGSVNYLSSPEVKALFRNADLHKIVFGLVSWNHEDKTQGSLVLCEPRRLTIFILTRSTSF